MTTMEYSQVDLYEFLTESELQHYYNAIKNELKITNAAQFKYATDEDLKSIGLSRPEIRRLRKFYEKYFPHGYLSKIKRLLQAPTTIVKRDDGSVGFAPSPTTQNPAAAAKPNSSPSKAPNNKHIIPADAISVNKQLGTGEFGIVQQGVWTNGTERIQVAIKCLCRERMQSNPMEFLKEAAIMHSIEHENIVRLYGVVLSTESLMLVTELAHLRSLLECLKDSGLRVSFLTVPTLCEFAMQICNGMRYLENKRLIHRDLAARNILVFSKNKVKISDFGLSRALGVGKDYYKTNFNVNLKLPIAWCAPECINYLRFTNASDVWAFGVCLWEMFSYGFQPWAALTGLQILEAIDTPNFQRLEQPDCCPTEYYTLMMKCWQDDPLKRPKFGEIYDILPDMKPEQLKAVVNYNDSKKDHLLYCQGEIITVLDRNTGTPYWKGVLNSGKTGYFNPSNTVAFLEGLPCSNRDAFCRVSDQRSSKRKLRTEMISKPQNDFKHTGHVGIDGVSFGDIAFLSTSQSYNHVPRQIVTPYKPSEDIEQTPLLQPPTPTSPDSLQTASGYFAEGATSMNPSFVPSTENTPKHINQPGQSTFEFPHQQNLSTNPFTQSSIDGQFGFALQNNNYSNDAAKAMSEEPHEYHEISDDEITPDKLDFGPSLLDEINSMFGSMGEASSNSANQPKSPDFEHVNIKNEFTELTSKLVGKNDTNGNSKFGTSSKKKNSSGTVKQISVKDEKLLNHAIEIANEISARSMIDLVSDQSHSMATHSPKRKFSFRFPHLSSNGSEKTHNNTGGTSIGTSGHGHQSYGLSSPYSKKKNFTEELKSIPDLQAIIGEEGREAYNSLIERKSSLTGVGISPVASLLRHLDTNEFDMTTAKTLPRASLHLRNGLQEMHVPVSNMTTSTIKTYKGDGTTVTVPLHEAPRPMTLPTRGAANRAKKVDMTFERIMQVSNNKENDNGNGPSCNNVNNQEQLSPCESPSYVQNNFYKFPEKSTDSTKDTEVSAVSPSEETNPLPLPSREGKKHIKTNAKRHVRKYPLIIPANGVQRTLSKVADMQNTTAHFAATQQQNQNQNQNHHKSVESLSTIRPNSVKSLGNGDRNSLSHTYQNLEDVNNDGTNDDTASLQFESILEADNNKCNVLQSPDVTDGFYNFSIQKEQYNKSKEVEIDPQKISGLYVNEDELRNLDIERSIRLNVSSNSVNSGSSESKLSIVSSLAPAKDVPPTVDENCEIKSFSSINSINSLSSSGLEKTKSTKNSSDNELAGNALFRKFKESADNAIIKIDINEKIIPSTNNSLKGKTNETMIKQEACKEDNHHFHGNKRAQTEGEYFAEAAARLAACNSVSCEDLLEFADKKPKGKERGVDSDEVRIMMKVLGKDSTPTRCLHVLEFIDWDVHKAIKLIKLQNIIGNNDLSLTQSIENLQKHDWDLHVTVLKLRKLKI